MYYIKFSKISFNRYNFRIIFILINSNPMISKNNKINKFNLLNFLIISKIDNLYIS